MILNIVLLFHKNSTSACKQRLTSWRTDHHPRLRKESRLLKKEEGKPSDKQECRSINMPPGLVESRRYTFLLIVINSMLVQVIV
jgi:hypothetical protein